MIRVCAVAFEVNAEETARFVLLMMLLIVLMTPFTATLEPMEIIPFVLAILNLVFVPVTNIEEAVTFTVPEIVLADVVEIVIVFDVINFSSFKSA
jgi:hypothetical protein